MQQRVNTANRTTASLVSHRKASSKLQQALRQDAACSDFWVLIIGAGSLCLTVDLGCTVSRTPALPSCPEWRPAFYGSDLKLVDSEDERFPLSSQSADPRASREDEETVRQRTAGFGFRV